MTGTEPCRATPAWAYNTRPAHERVTLVHADILSRLEAALTGLDLPDLSTRSTTLPNEPSEILIYCQYTAGPSLQTLFAHIGWPLTGELHTVQPTFAITDDTCWGRVRLTVYRTVPDHLILAGWDELDVNPNLGHPSSALYSLYQYWDASTADPARAALWRTALDRQRNTDEALRIAYNTHRDRIRALASAAAPA